MLKKITNTLRALSIDMIDTAQSGHPGIALGAAPIVNSVFNCLKFNPKDDDFFNRDRFVLSAGHGSSLLYSAIHLFTDGLTISDLKKFRTLNSKTPGHPEKNATPFVEVSTGPLGQGVANAVGMAIAERKLATTFNKPHYNIVDHYTYVLAGDGCLMEGVAMEALDIASNLNLNKLIVLFDSNDITMEGKASLAQVQNTQKVYKAKGFNVILVKDSEKEEAIFEAIKKAKKSNKPNLIIINTTIGYGSEIAGTSEVHGLPLGIEASKKVKAKFGLSTDMFVVDEDVSKYLELLKDKKIKEIENELTKLDNYKKEFANDYVKLTKFLQSDYTFKSNLPLEKEPKSTRDLGGKYLNEMAGMIPNLIGGSADVAPSTRQYIINSTYANSGDFSGRNFHFGVREHAMVAVLNGVLAHGGFKTFCSTFMVFSDYAKPALRMAALMNLPLMSIFTSDSIGAGEDGPTHQPIEQLAMLRAMPNMYVFRPADEKETVASYEIAATLNGPSAIVLTRQKLPQLKETSKDKAKNGLYIVFEPKGEIEGIILSSGSELNIAIAAAIKLEEKGKNYRVVSCFSLELFNKMDASYKEQILPKNKLNRIAVEASSSFGLAKLCGVNGKYLTIDEFGKSAKSDELFEFFKISTEQIVKLALKV